MKILMGLNAPWVGGTRIYVLTLAQGLVRRGHSVRLITDGGVLVEETQARGITALPRRSSLETNLDLLLGEVQKEKPDLIHAHPAASILESFLLSRITGIPFIVTMHGEYPMAFTQDPLGRQVSQGVGRVIAVSENVRNYLLRQTPLTPDKVLVIPNGIDTQEFCPCPISPEDRSKLGLTSDQKVVMYLGRLDADKRSGILATATVIEMLAHEGATVKGIFVGRGSLEGELSGRPNLLLTGFRRDLPQLLRVADVVVATGRSALEAMAIGKPVLAIGKAGYLGVITAQNWPQAVETNFADHGDLPTPDPAIISAELRSLLAQPERCQRLGSTLRHLVCQYYDLNRVLEQTERVYAEVCRV